MYYIHIMNVYSIQSSLSEQSDSWTKAISTYSSSSLCLAFLARCSSSTASKSSDFSSLVITPKTTEESQNINEITDILTSKMCIMIPMKQEPELLPGVECRVIPVHIHLKVSLAVLFLNKSIAESEPSGVARL